jgi:hypothetical protein
MMNKINCTLMILNIQKKEWVDIESPTFVNRNKVSMKTIVNQMINWRIFD